MVIAVSLLFLPFTLLAQNSTSTLRGVVQDATAGRVAGARIIVRLAGLVVPPSPAGLLVNDRGEFRIDGLLPGPYEVTVTAKGFAEAKADVDTAVSVVRDITITLKPAGGHKARTVNVKGNSFLDYNRNTRYVERCARRCSGQP